MFFWSDAYRAAAQRADFGRETSVFTDIDAMHKHSNDSNIARTSFVALKDTEWHVLHIQ